MKKKIFKNMFLVSAVFIIISILISTMLLYTNMENNVIEGNKTDAEYISYFADEFGEEYITSNSIPNGRRITLISSDGNVIFDSEAENKDLENHLNRLEVKEALKNGIGSDKRISNTFKETTFYYAIQLKSNNILRVATTTDTIYATFANLVPIAIVLLICILTVVMMVSNYLTKKIVSPLNELDLNEPESITIYEEMSPFISRIANQNEVIKKQIKNLRVKQIEFETITGNMNEGLIVLDKSGQTISYNNSALNLLEVSINDKQINNFLVFNRSSKFEKVVNKALKGTNGECSLVFEDKTCQIMTNPVIDNDKIKGAVILIIDITEKEKREALRREFSANVSHELKTPLTSISGYAEIIKSGIVKEQDIIKFSEVIYSEAGRLIELIEDIIKVSKLDEDNVQLEETSINVNDILYNIVKRLKKYSESKNVTIEVINKTNTIIKIKGISQIVDELIYNVVENAIKYNKNDGKVIITLTQEYGSKNIIVEDTGIGIPQKYIDRVFERFYRVDKSHSKKVSGTGLGLSIVKHSAAFLGAEVMLQSEENKGTKVTIKF